MRLWVLAFAPQRASSYGSAVSLWLSKSVVAAIVEQLVDGPTATAGVPRIHKALASIRNDIAPWSPQSENLAALVVGDVSNAANWDDLAESWRPTLAPGGILLSVGRRSASLASQKLLCAGFTDLQQVRVGRRLVTSGRLGPQAQIFGA